MWVIDVYIVILKVNELDYLLISVIELFIVLIVFFVLMGIGTFIYKRIRNSSNQFLNPLEYFPQEELHSLKQVFILIIMALCFINVLYSMVFYDGDLIYFAIFDILLSVFIASTIKRESNWDKLLVILLVPYGSLCYVFFRFQPIALLDFIHIPVFLYMVKYYYDKFREYTQTNSLGVTIVLLFAIIFISFLVTVTVESGNPLDSLVMVSNAFTSNGYAVLGSTIPGKINSIFLVWSGYIISGVGTATLTVAILTKYFNKRLDELEELIKKNNED